MWCTCVCMQCRTDVNHAGVAQIRDLKFYFKTQKRGVEEGWQDVAVVGVSDTTKTAGGGSGGGSSSSATTGSSSRESGGGGGGGSAKAAGSKRRRNKKRK